jgi:hypothetical protein
VVTGVEYGRLEFNQIRDPPIRSFPNRARHELERRTSREAPV